MNLNLGKILFWIMLLPVMSWAEASAKLSKSIIHSGEEVRLTLSGSGNRVQFPDITEIEGFPVEGTSTRSSTTIINGKMSQLRSKSYSFSPEHDLVIPTYTLVVNGKKEVTAPLTLRVAKSPNGNSQSGDVKLVMTADKNSSYVGEPIRVDLTYKSLTTTHYDKVELSEPTFKKFWTKKVQGLKQGMDGAYITQTYSYILFPQEEGNFTLEAPFVQIGTRVGGYSDPFFGNIGVRMNWRKLFANPITLEVKPLPNGLEVYGDFSIKARVDKQEVKANKPVNLTIDIKGEGNLDDIKKFTFDIDNAVVYSDELKVSNSGLTRGVVTQKVAIVADRNFTIPALSFSFFDKKTKKEKTIKTEPIEIKVLGSGTQAPKETHIEQKAPLVTLKEPVVQAETNSSVETTTSDSSSTNKLLWYLLGLLSGILLTMAGWFIGQKVKYGYKKKEMPFIKKLKRVKTDKELFELLLPYRDDDKLIKEALLKLEKNIYASGKEKIDLEEIIDFFEETL